LFEIDVSDAVYERQVKLSTLFRNVVSDIWGEQEAWRVALFESLLEGSKGLGSVQGSFRLDSETVLASCESKLHESVGAHAAFGTFDSDDPSVQTGSLT
jgi:hypothetical protein